MTITHADLDADLHTAWLLRRAAWDQLADKDTPLHRQAWDEACGLVDDVLDRINEARQ